MAEQSEYKVIYLTGAPATGKSTLIAELERRVTPLTTYSYGRLLIQHVAERDHVKLGPSDIRRHSAKVVRPEDVMAVDARLIEAVDRQRTLSHVIIDSHAVTKESYGFRVTPFSIERVRALNPHLIIVLYADSSVVLHRILANSQGRPTISEFEATMHNDLQGSVGLIYGIHLGIPIYFLNSDRNPHELAEEVARRICK